MDNNGENTFIFTFVRMNPPTPGHLLVIKSMILEAIRLNVNKIYILLSSSMDEKNPLVCSKETIPEPKKKTINNNNLSNEIIKIDILKNMIDSYKQKMTEEETDPIIKIKIQNIKVMTICSSGNPIKFINSIITTEFSGRKNIDIFFIAGEDRIEFFNTINKIFSNNKNINSINSKILTRHGMESLNTQKIQDISIRHIPLEQYSATFVRNLVRLHDKDSFKQVYQPYLEESKIDTFYNTLLQNLSEYEKSNKNKTKKRNRPSPSPSSDSNKENEILETNNETRKKAKTITSKRRTSRNYNKSTNGGKIKINSRKNKNSRH